MHVLKAYMESFSAVKDPVYTRWTALHGHCECQEEIEFPAGTCGVLIEV